VLYPFVRRVLLPLPQLPPRLHKHLNMLRIRRSAIPRQPAPLQRLRIRRLETRWTQHGEVAADLRELFRSKWLLGGEIGAFGHLLLLFAMVARGRIEVNPLELVRRTRTVMPCFCATVRASRSTRRRIGSTGSSRRPKLSLRMRFPARISAARSSACDFSSSVMAPNTVTIFRGSAIEHVYPL
jgi:hypothetical protein